MTAQLGPAERLFHHQPVLKYDSQESYFADSAASWVECPGNILIRAKGGPVSNTGGGLSLDFLGKTYADKVAARAGDTVSDQSKEYRVQAAELHLDARYRNRIYGRETPDGRWLQYWFFYFYNDYNLIGNLIGAGRHEGDWEMVQIHLDAQGAPDRAVYAQHDHAGSRPWKQVDLLTGTERPIVYVARGSHASYFEPGVAWTGHWFDHADGRRRSPDQKLLVMDEGKPAWRWLGWPGHWGDTVEGDLPIIDSSSPTGPARHRQWDDPGSLERPVTTRETGGTPEPPLPPAPLVKAAFDGGKIRVNFRLPDGAKPPKGLAVTVNAPDEHAPPTTHQIEVDAASGSVVVPHEAKRSQRYDLYVSQADADGLASPSTRAELAPHPDA